MARPVVKPKERISASPTMEKYIAHYAIEDICWLYMDRDLADHLRRLSWREARRRVLRQGPLDKEWVSHRHHPPVRLTRRGVEVRLGDGVWLFGWERMQAQIRARRY